MEPTGETPATDIVMPGASDPGRSRWRGRWWVPVALVALLGAVVTVLVLTSGDDSDRSIEPATTVADSSDTTTTVATASTAGEAETTTEVADATTSAPSTTSNTRLSVAPVTTRAPSHTSPPTTANSPTECLEGCTFGPVGTNCVSMQISVVLSDAQGVASAVIDWSYPSGGASVFGHTVLSGATEPGASDWRGIVEMPVPPELNFFGTLSAIDGAGELMQMVWQIPAPQCGSSTTTPETSTTTTAA